MSEIQKLQESAVRRSVKLPRAVLPSPQEAAPTPQQRVTAAVHRFERGWVQKFGSSRDQREWGDCNIAPDIFSYVAQDEGRRNNFSPMVKMYQLLDLHAAAGGSRRAAFQHAFNTISVGDESFLVDLTFSQFLGKDGHIKWGPQAHASASQAPNSNLLAQELVTNGFVSLTDENLQEYLRITSEAEDKSYAENITTKTLETVRTLPVELIPEDGINPDFGLS